MFTLYNSYVKKNEELLIKNNIVNMYVCGPTVYNYIHIGNARPLIVFDILRRTLEFSGIKVKHVSNITDIDDKIIDEAKAQNISEQELTAKFIKIFNEDVKKLNILAPDFQPTVVENMNEIINIIQNLIDNNYAYISNKGDVYFDISKSKNYGILSNLNRQKQINNAANRLNEIVEGTNFTLWKLSKKGITFNSPWGKGRPGWHTECVAFISKYFNNEEITIHGGGLDLKFPHHTNEIAQGEAIFNHRLANHWVHNGFVQVQNEKMSKSLGNIVLIKDLLKERDYLVVKLLFLSTHYQKPVNFTEIELDQLTKVSLKIKNILTKISQLNISKEIKNLKHTNNVIKFLQDNLNTANALSELYLVIKNFNKAQNEKEQIIFGCEILNITKILGLR